MRNRLFGKDIITVETLQKEDIDLLFEKTKEMEKLVKNKGGDDRLKRKILAALFYEPSTRTFSSFITAIQRLGGGFIPLNGMVQTSVAKGESLEDTVKVFSYYSDVIVVRFPEVGSAKKAAESVSVPVINAGDGAGEHPTQALLDTYTIKKHVGTFSSLTVGIIGDLLYGRTVHSLTKLLFKLGVGRFIFVSPKVLKMPREICNQIKNGKGKVLEVENLSDVIGEIDVIYDTRIQKERFSDFSLYERLKHFYIIEAKLMEKAKKDAILMHPLPRVGEIAVEVDSDPRALYFREQLRNGLYLRMALLDLILRR